MTTLIFIAISFDAQVIEAEWACQKNRSRVETLVNTFRSKTGTPLRIPAALAIAIGRLGITVAQTRDLGQWDPGGA